jgi:hypothetical protein
LKFKSFSLPKDFYIFLIIPFKIIYFRRLVNKVGFNSLLSGFEGNNFTKAADEKFIKKLNKFYKASSFFLIKIFKDPNICMIRSLILYQLCSRNNIKASLVTGVNKRKGMLAGHSWLEINGEPFNEDKIFISNFTVISEV